MKNIILAGMTLGLLLAACNGGGGSTPAPTPDTEKPTVSLSATPNPIKAAGDITLIATAKDNIGVAKVEFYNGTKKLGEDTTAPYQMTMPVTSAENGKLSFMAKAVDAAGNMGESAVQDVTVNIPAVDKTAPTIVSVTPTKDAKGVYAKTNIVITFSEPMNKVNTQAAFQSSNIGKVTFTWNTSGTQMTVNPNDDLKYTEMGKYYSYKITNVATDLAGNAMASTPEFKFRTLREQMKIIKASADWNAYIYGDGTMANNTQLIVGDVSNNKGSRAMMTFDLSMLPNTLKYQDIIYAKLQIRVWSIIGNPIVDLRSAIGQKSFYLEPIKYFKPVNINAYNANIDDGKKLFYPVGSPTGTLKVGWNESNVMSILMNDWKNKASNGSKAQYRLAFPKITDSDNQHDYVRVYSAKTVYAPKIVVKYRIP